jgi:heme A synthase
MYTTILIVHSWMRWLALIAGVGVTFAAVMGRVEPENESPADRWGLVAMTALDIQMLLGLLLYLVVSPNMAEIRAHFGEAMQSAQLRFWAVEHLTAMLVAVIVAHVGRVLARKARTPTARRRRLIICFGVSTLAMILGMPWPGTPAGRPLFRF